MADIEIRNADTGERIDVLTIGGAPVGVWPGDRGLLHDSVSAVKSSLDVLQRRAEDLKTAPIGDHERADRVRQMAAATLAEVEPFAARAVESISAITADIARASPVTDPKAASYHEVTMDLEVARHLRDLPPIQRASILAELKADPTSHPEYLAAALRVPPMLLGISREEQAALKRAAYEAAAPEHAGGLKVAASQAAVVIEAARIALAGLRKHGGNPTPDAAVSRLANLNAPNW